MQIQSPSRETIRQALNVRSAELIRRGDVRGAERVQKDLAVLSGASGDTLYEIYRQASEKARSLPEETSLADYWLDRPALSAVAILSGAVGGTLTFISSLPPSSPVGVAVGLGLVGAVTIATGVTAYRVAQSKKHRGILAAVERQQDFVRAYTPSLQPAPACQIDRKVFLTALQTQEARLAETGSMARALEIRQVHQALSSLPGNTVEELFVSLIQSKDRQVLDLVQGPCSGEIAEAVETLDQVGKLGAPGALNVREEAGSIVIGGVVLKKRAA
ncbi:MAG: hypothetical protein AB1758_04600 [Candidatus Eremiobacterota bacterium]